MNRKKWVLIYGIGLTAFTIYISLDTFVISSAYTKNANEINTAVFDNVKNESSQQETDSTSHKSGEHKGPGKGKLHFREDENTQKTEDSETSDTTEQSSEDNTGTSDKSTITETSQEQAYSDENVEISLKTYDYNDTKVNVADIQLSSAEYLKTAFAEDTYGKNITAKTSEIAGVSHRKIMQYLLQDWLPK